MNIEKCTYHDFLEITQDIVDFWGSERTLVHHHPFLIHEFGNTAYAIKENNKVIAYLFGFLSQTEKSAYVHLIGVRNEHQRKGFGEQLYKHFIEQAKSYGCKKIKAITSPINKQSIKFHTERIGMQMLGEAKNEGIKVVENYSGLGQDRVVFEKQI